MENYTVYESDGNTVLKELETNDKINVGDTIEYISNNQLGYEKYRVIDKDGKKDIELIADYDGEYEGGKRKNHKHKSHKRKSHKRKSHKHKSHKRKSHKRRARK
jgi:hypothetical protein